MKVTITSNRKPKKVVVSSDKPGVSIVNNAKPVQVVVSTLKNGRNGLNAFELWQLVNPDGTIEEYRDYFRGTNGLDAFELWQVDNPGGTIEQYREYFRGLDGLTAKQVWLIDHPGMTEMDYYEWTRGAKLWGDIEGDLQDQTDLMQILDAKLNSSLVGAANGLAPIGNDGKISTAYFPDEILGNVRFRGTYNGNTVSSAYVAYNGLPLPNPSTSNAGVYFIVTAPFTKDGIDYSNGDWILSIGALSGWSKVDNSDSVTSVFGRVGNIIAIESDYQAFYVRLSQVYNNPSWIGSLSKSKVGLANVDNTADVDKPVSNPQKAYIDAGDLASIDAGKESYLAQTADYQSASAVGQRKMFNCTPNGELNLTPGLYKLTLAASLSTLNSNNLNFAIAGSAVVSNVNVTGFVVKGVDWGVQTQSVTLKDFNLKQIHTSNSIAVARILLVGSFRVTSAGTIQPTIGGNLSMSPTTEIGSMFRVKKLGAVGDNHSADAS